MRVRHVVTAVQIVVNVHFPVAIQGVDAAIKNFTFPSGAGGLPIPELSPEKSATIPLPHPDLRIQNSPRCPRQRETQTIFRAIEIAYAFEFDHAF